MESLYDLFDIFSAILILGIGTISGIVGAFSVITWLMKKSKTFNDIIIFTWGAVLDAVFKKRAEEIKELQENDIVITGRLDTIDDEISTIEIKLDDLRTRTKFNSKQYKETKELMREQFDMLNKRMDRQDEMNSAQMKLIEQMIYIMKGENK